jgi:hypothetical protein
MMNTQTTAMKLVLALFCALALAACSKKKAANLEAGLGAGGSGLSGSEAQMWVTVYSLPWTNPVFRRKPGRRS